MGFGIDFDIGAALGGYFQGKSAEEANQANIDWEREKAQNYHQYEVQDLIKAGLNPILSADSHASLGGANQIPASPIGNALNNAIAIRLQKKQAEAQIATQEAQARNLNAQTARTIALTPEEIKTHQFGRESQFEKQYIDPAIKYGRKLIKIMDEQAKQKKTTAEKEKNLTQKTRNEAKKQIESWKKDTAKRIIPAMTL